MSMKLDSPTRYNIGWIAALPIERAAAVASLDERHQEPEDFEQHETDHNSYSWGRTGEHNVVIASLKAGVIGKVSAATTALQLLSSLPHIKIGLLVGIGGGVPKLPSRDIRLGDVVVSQPEGTGGGVIQYDLGKAVGENWERKGSLNTPPDVLLNALANIQAEHLLASSKVPEFLKLMLEAYPKMAEEEPGFVYQGLEHDRFFDSGHVHKGSADCHDCSADGVVQRAERRTTNPRIHYGTIGSGDSVVKDAVRRDEIGQVVGGQCMCLEMEAAGLMNQFPCLVIRGICDYADTHKNDRWQQYASATAAAYAKELLLYVPSRQLRSTARALDAIQSVGEQVKSVKEDVRNMSERLHQNETEQFLARLQVVNGAAYNDLDESENSWCLPGTRVELLNQVDRWVTEAHLQTKSIFWLDGRAGTGKSTIARTVATNVDASGNLGASFFFKRGEGDRGRDSKLITTLASQLARKRPEMAAILKAVLQKDPEIVNKGLPDQLDRLIIQPYSELILKEGGTSRPTVIIIDALDECEHNRSGSRPERVFGLLEQIGKAGLRLFVTSRPEIRSRVGLETLDGQYTKLILHEIPERTIREDISTYLRAEMPRIRDEYNAAHQAFPISLRWPAEQQLQQLIGKSIPLFLFAATVCRFLRDETAEDPETELNRILSRQGDNSALDSTYEPFLSRILLKAKGGQRSRAIESFVRIVGSIVILFEPLSIAALAALLDLEPRSVSNELDRLHSVLSVPSDPYGAPVRLFHLSFRDFLVDPEKRDSPSQFPFWVNESKAHARLATDCLRVMKATLKRDICDLRLPGTARSEISPEVIKRCLPPEVQYACRYWVDHCKGSGRLVRDDGPEYLFLMESLLYWLEALSLQGFMRESLDMIDDLLLLLDAEGSSRSFEFLQDARRVVLEFRSAVDQWPLQLYYSALIFTPQESVVRRHFSFESSKELVPPKVEAQWDASLQSFEGHAKLVKEMVFSHDSELLASADDSVVKLWHVSSGKCIASFPLPEYESFHRVNLAFSPDSSTLAIASRTHAYRRYFKQFLLIAALDTTTGSVLTRHLLTEYEVDTNEKNYMESSFMFSPDLSLYISMNCGADLSTHSLKLRDTRTGEMVRHLVDHESTLAARFSPDSKSLLSVSKDMSIKLWDVASGECVETRYLPGRYHRPSNICVSKNLDLLTFSYTTNYQLRKMSVLRRQSLVTISINLVTQTYFEMWDMTRGNELTRLKGVDPYSDARFSISNDSKLVAACTEDGKLGIWDTSTGLRKGLVTESFSVTAFSHDSRILASTPYDGTIRIRDTAMVMRNNELMNTQQREDVAGLKFSPNAELFAVRQWNNCAELFDARSVQPIATLREGKYLGPGKGPLGFSPDSRLFAMQSSSSQTMRVWDSHTGVVKVVLESPLRLYVVVPVVFSDDSNLLMVEAQDDEGCTAMILWNLGNQGPPLVLRLGAWRPCSVPSFTSDSRFVEIKVVGGNPLKNDVQRFSTATGEPQPRVDMRDVGYEMHSNGHPSTASSSDSSSAGDHRITTHQGIGLDGPWVTWDSLDYLWLPPSYRPNSYGFEVMRSSLLFQRVTGDVIVIRIIEDLARHDSNISGL